jgi:hypothetical protein
LHIAHDVLPVAVEHRASWRRPSGTCDLNGNFASDDVNQYGWNAQNLMAQISGTTSASFTYDMFWRRSDQTVNGHRLQSFWIDDELSFQIPDNDWARRIRQFSLYPEWARLADLPAHWG